jgi:hypothetical protein
MFYTYMPAAVDDTTAIPAALLNRLRVDIGRAIDGTGGGSYTPASVINVQGSGFGTINVATMLEVKLGGQYVDPVGAQIADVNNQTFALAGGQIREFAANGGNRVHDLSNADATPGSWIHFVALPGNVGSIKINRAGFGAGVEIVTMPAAQWGCATVYRNGAAWRLLRASGNCTAGPDA